jgi:lipid A 3-O-deacylase
MRIVPQIMIPCVRFGFSCIVLAFAASSAIAGHEVADKSVSTAWDPFAKGQMEFQLGAGGFYSFGNESEVRPRIVDIGGAVRLGWMLTDVSSEGWCRGNWEFLAEIYGAGIVEGPGDVFVAATILLRYNFVQENSRWVPYFQFGGGGIYSDAHEDQIQRAIGSEYSFNLQGGFGLRYLCNDRCAVYIEALYRHISNAGLGDRNLGTNAVGGFVGVSYFF